ncbi:MAG: hypothetical protein IJ184_03865 [Alphaproteobacteria bacterium]|nr:hypothetical protein [Alphaproteobacteria bacterium]
MSEIGALGSYINSMQQLQMSIIKQNAETQQQLLEVLTDAMRSVPVSQDKGGNLDICV